MSEYLLSPRGNYQAEADLKGMLDSGKLDAYRVRGNGTMRLLKLLPVGGRDRDTAEWIYDQIEDGRSVQAVAREIHSSSATVRRFLEALEITEQVEAGEWDQVWADTNGFDYQPPTDELGLDELAAVFNGEWAGTTPSLLADVENTDTVDSEATNA